MSFSKEVIESPIKKYISWNGSKGYFYYWDKEAINTETGEEGLEVIMPEKFQVIPLDITKYVGGHNEATNKPIRSNEVRHMGQPLEVKTSAGIHIASGTWKEIGDAVKANGGSFGNNVYCLYLSATPEIVCLKIVGSAMQGLMNAKDKKTASFKIANNQHVLTCGIDSEVFKKGNVLYRVPTFIEKKFPVIDAMSEKQKTLYDAAYDADLVLQAFLDDKFSNKADVAQPAATPISAPPMDLSSNAPLNVPSPAKAPVPSSDNDTDDLPF